MREFAAGAVRDPPDVRARGRGGDRLPRRRVPLARARGGVHVPAYRAWLDGQDFTPAYGYLRRMLQLLQWQKRQRGDRSRDAGCSRRRRTSATSTTCSPVPRAHVVHMHRTRVETIPSGASLNATLGAMHADDVDLHRVGAEWLERMGWTNDRAMAARDCVGGRGRSGSPTSSSATRSPTRSARSARVYDAIGLELTADAEAAMRRWLATVPASPCAPLRARARSG